MGQEDKQAAIELAKVVEGLRNELEKAQELGEGKAIRFGVNEIELELELTIAQEIKASGGLKGKADSGAGLVKYFVGKLGGEISVQGEGKYQKLSTQKIKLSLSAKNTGDSQADDSDVYLSGDDR